MGKFVPPPPETNAIKGAPTLEEGVLGSVTGGPGFRAVMAKEPVLTQGEIFIYFTSPETNEVWMTIELLDEEGKVICESGLLKPGEYVDRLAVLDGAVVGKSVWARVLSYEPDTYLSHGSVSIELLVKAR